MKNSECLEGYYRDALNNECTPCPIGTYRGNDTDEQSCTSCPAGNTTAQEGSSQPSHCVPGNKLALLCLIERI